MGLIKLLKFALICIDFLAWPVVGLGYPLFATIRAIESDSKYHLRKLAMYWTLFSSISLFEYAFMKIIEWLPFWSSIKLVVIFWLVIPEFDGASLAYQSLVRPSLSVNLQQLTNRFSIPKKEKLQKIETFLDVAEKYIQENGSEALQKLLSSKGDCKEPDNSQRDIQVLESEKKVVAAASKLLKEPEAAQKANETQEAKGKSASADTKLVLNAKSSSVAWVRKGTDAAAEVEAMTPPQDIQPETPPRKQTKQEYSQAIPLLQVHNAKSSSVAWVRKGTDAAAEVEAMTPPRDIQPETPPPKQIKQEWTCILRNVKTTSEMESNTHLGGKKHNAMCEALKTSKQYARSTGPSISATAQSNQRNREAVKQKQDRLKQNVDATQQFKLCCNLCNVKLISKVDMEAHLKGRRHSANIALAMDTVSPYPSPYDPQIPTYSTSYTSPILPDLSPGWSVGWE